MDTIQEFFGAQVSPTFTSPKSKNDIILERRLIHLKNKERGKLNGEQIYEM